MHYRSIYMRPLSILDGAHKRAGHMLAHGGTRWWLLGSFKCKVVFLCFACVCGYLRAICFTLQSSSRACALCALETSPQMLFRKPSSRKQHPEQQPKDPSTHVQTFQRDWHVNMVGFVLCTYLYIHFMYSCTHTCPFIFQWCDVVRCALFACSSIRVSFSIVAIEHYA